MEQIKFFQRETYFLSNFYSSPIIAKDILYPTVEHAFQAAKTTDLDKRFEISLLKTPNDAKQAGQRVGLRRNWEEIKPKVMLKLVRKKFEIPALRVFLLKTGDKELIEGNIWGDRYWGVCNGVGKNVLGKVLMKVRDEIR